MGDAMSADVRTVAEVVSDMRVAAAVWASDEDNPARVRQAELLHEAMRLLDTLERRARHAENEAAIYLRAKHADESLFRAEREQLERRAREAERLITIHEDAAHELLVELTQLQKQAAKVSP